MLLLQKSSTKDRIRDTSPESLAATFPDGEEDSFKISLEGKNKLARVVRKDCRSPRPRLSSGSDNERR